MQALKGLHHVTAVCGNPQINLNFYQGVLGQRLVKRTVNFDDPGTYHLYYGDRVGAPGTILTFFPWLHMKNGRRGTGETFAVAYAIHPKSLEYWEHRLKRHQVAQTITQERFGDIVLQFNDPHGMNLELITTPDPADISPWESGPVPESNTLAGLHSVTLWVTELEGTAKLLQDQLGYQFLGQEGHRYRFQAEQDEPGHYLDIEHRPGYPYAFFGSGSIHHIALRVENEQQQLAYRELLRSAGYRVTPVQDRQYFRSIYFRSPGGVLFELATDLPGFSHDESIEELGSTLKLPPWLEAQRQDITSRLPALEFNPSALGSA